jgi:hypothetical protein
MDFNIPPVGGVDRAGSPPRSAPASKSGFGASLEAAVNAGTLPASPPPSVLEDMHVAGRVVVQLRDLDGNVIRDIPPVRALEIAAGAPLD